ncbi:CPBP family intramembrane glutamic endopeptidase [Phenylobacterium sp.]|uniref:CPBP family intramembrane glutamic endopeptidase n=1 Tax=Phenylobacterium sp. TaxID=1871053 RepID=UPI002DF072AC|nr:CPBP family intramembrane glutamic endopeptidase [Phenylobacterium sp.]
MPRLLKLAVFALAALLLTLLPGGVWSGLLAANLKTGIGLPWAVPVMGGLLWLGWRYAGGHGPPARTAQARRRYRRANPVSAQVWRWALAANGLALAALSGLWIVLFQLVKAPGNPTNVFAGYPPATVILIVVTGAVIGAVSEEVGIRGYLQGALERVLPAPAAILVAALVLTPGHGLTQGFVWSTLLFYVLVDVAYGATAYFTNSIYPGVIAHAAGLMVFFLMIWPHDATRRLVGAGGADAWFWLHLVQAVGFGALAIAAFARLAALRPRAPA